MQDKNSAFERPNWLAMSSKGVGSSQKAQQNGGSDKQTPETPLISPPRAQRDPTPLKTNMFDFRYNHHSDITTKLQRRAVLCPS